MNYPEFKTVFWHSVAYLCHHKIKQSTQQHSFNKLRKFLEGGSKDLSRHDIECVEPMPISNALKRKIGEYGSINSMKQYLEELAAKNSFINISFENPDNQREDLIKLGMIPSKLTVEEEGKLSEAIIFPWAIISFGKKTKTLNKVVDPEDEYELVMDVRTDKDFVKGKSSFKHGLFLCTILGVLLFLMVFFAKPLMYLMNQPEEKQYWGILFPLPVSCHPSIALKAQS